MSCEDCANGQQVPRSRKLGEGGTTTTTQTSTLVAACYAGKCACPAFLCVPLLGGESAPTQLESSQGETTTERHLEKVTSGQVRNG